MIRRFLATIVLCFSEIAAAGAEETPKESFETLLEQVKKADPKADFLKLRMAFTETTNYEPYGDAGRTRKSMTEALDKKDYAKAIELAEQVLRSNYVDLRAHMVASHAFKEMKNDEKAKYHKYVFDGLVQSILTSGDGKDRAKSWVVISTDEEYVVLEMLGIRSTGQALVGDKDQKFDRVNGVDLKRDERMTVYFNVTTQFRWLEKQLKKE
jgi:hypothetical protein